MDNKVYTIDEISQAIRPIAEKYQVAEVYIFGSYARGEATAESDIDLLIKGKESFKPSNVFAVGEELRMLLQKAVDIFEMRELNVGTPFYEQVLSERVGLT